MLGIGFQELLLILVVAIVVVGPKKLPDLAKSLGKGLQEFRKATDGIKSTLHDNEAFKDLQGIKSTVQDTMSSLNPSGLLDIDAKPVTPAQPAPELKKFETPAAPVEAAAQILKPKKPEETLDGRIVLMDGIVSEHHQPGADIAATASDAMAVNPSPAPVTPTSSPQPAAQPVPKKSDA